VELAIPEQVVVGPDQTVIRFTPANLTGEGMGTPSWSPSEGLDNPNVFNPQATPDNTTEYILTLTDTNGCITSDTTTVSVIVPIPNAITPNGDGTNDFFVVDKIENFPNSSFAIYNRYNNIVFEEAPYTNSWNGASTGGKDLPDGTYYYAIDFGDGRPSQIGYVLIKR